MLYYRNEHKCWLALHLLCITVFIESFFKDLSTLKLLSQQRDYNILVSLIVQQPKQPFVCPKKQYWCLFTSVCANRPSQKQNKCCWSFKYLLCLLHLCFMQLKAEIKDNIVTMTARPFKAIILFLYDKFLNPDGQWLALVFPDKVVIHNTFCHKPDGVSLTWILDCLKAH